MPPNPQVVITGFGVISPIGIGRAAFRDSLQSAQSRIGAIRRFDASGMDVRFGGEVLDFEPKALIRPRKSLKVMSRGIQFGVAAAELAIEDAGLELASLAPERKGVVFGADFIYGGFDELIPTYRDSIIDGRFDFSRWGDAAMREIYPLWMLKHLPNMTACHIAIAHDARGHNNTIVLGEASSLLALGEGARVIERGWADVMIVGGTSCARLHPTPLTYRGGQLLSRRNDDPSSACRPFDADRDGMVNGEGAAAFVLESLRHAVGRGASPIAELLGFASRYERIDFPDQQPLGHAIRNSISASLDASGLTPTQVGHVNANGFGTVAHDIAEACAIQAMLGDVPVTAPKSYFGNLGAAAGAVEMAASLIALEEGQIPMTLNYERPDPACPVQVVHGDSKPSRQPTALLLNQTTLGQAVAAVIAGPEAQN